MRWPEPLCLHSMAGVGECGILARRAVNVSAVRGVPLAFHDDPDIQQLHALEGGDKHLCVLRFETTKASSSYCAVSTRESSAPASFGSTAVGCASSASRKRTAPSAARPSAIAGATRPSSHPVYPDRFGAVIGAR